MSMEPTHADESNIPCRCAMHSVYITQTYNLLLEANGLNDHTRATVTHCIVTMRDPLACSLAAPKKKSQQ